MKAKSIKGNSSAEIRDALLSAMQEDSTNPFKPSVGIAFISVKLDRTEICKIFNDAGIDIIGATSSGEFIEGHQSEGAAVILLLEINKDYYKPIFRAIGDEGMVEYARSFAGEAVKIYKNPAFILFSTAQSADGTMIQGETLLRSIEDIAGSDVNIFGGMAGDDITFTGTYVFSNNESTDYGMTALVIDQEKISVSGLAISGWKAVGITRTATKTEDNIIHEIDGQPALELYLRFLGTDIISQADSATFFDVLGIQYPFQIERTNREPMMCTPIRFDKAQGSLICEANVPQGSKFRFSTPPDFDIIETVIEQAEVLKEQAGTDAEALLIFSCAGRLSALGPLAHQENQGLQQVWNAPMAGFYTYGEYGKGRDGKHEFHSTTCSWVALTEK